MTQSPPTPSQARSEVPGALYYAFLGLITLIAASWPYLYGYFHTPPGEVYTGLSYNIDDSCVYLSWMRQAQQGHFFLHDRFTSEPQRGVLFNLLFLLLGNIVRITHLPPIAVYHGARLLGGGLFLGVICRLLRSALTQERTRRIAYALICVSAGFGWMWGGYVIGHGNAQPVDLWQPEAISFLSLYFAPLFSCALALIVLFMLSVLHTEQRGRLRDAVPAMIAGALLGNFHSYDVIALFSTWFVFRIVQDVSGRQFELSAWLRFVAVGLVSLPTTVYVFWATRVETVFYQRAFISATPSPALIWDLLGFGLPFLLAVAAIAGFGRAPRSEGGSPALAFRLLVTWMLVGIAVAYVPVAFQRKLLMGAHVPICLLAGMALAALSARLSGDFPKIVVLFGVLVTVPTNILFLMRDVDRLAQNESSTSIQPFLKTSELDALNYLRDNARPEDIVLVSPDASSQNRYPNNALEPFLAVYVPALAGLTTYVGHWSETADYGPKLNAMRAFYRQETPDAERAAFLADKNIRYLVYDNRLAAGPIRDSRGAVLPLLKRGTPYIPVDWVKGTAPAYLRIEFQNADVTIYGVVRTP